MVLRPVGREDVDGDGESDMDGQLFEMMYREREAELDRAVEERRRARAARERAALPFTSPRKARRAPHVLDTRHRAA